MRCHVVDLLGLMKSRSHYRNAAAGRRGCDRGCDSAVSECSGEPRGDHQLVEALGRARQAAKSLFFLFFLLFPPSRKKIGKSRGDTEREKGSERSNVNRMFEFYKGNWGGVSPLQFPGLAHRLPFPSLTLGQILGQDYLQLSTTIVRLATRNFGSGRPAKRVDLLMELDRSSSKKIAPEAH